VDLVIILSSAKTSFRWLEQQIRSLSAAPLSPHTFLGSGWDGDARNLKPLPVYDSPFFPLAGHSNNHSLPAARGSARSRDAKRVKGLSWRRF